VPTNDKSTTGSLEPLIPLARVEVLMQLSRVLLPIVVILCVGLVALCSLCVWLVYRDTHRQPLYFATDGRGRITPIDARDQPTITRQAASQYLVDALGETLSFDFSNYSDTLSQSGRRYTPDALDSLVKQLEESGILKAVKERRLVLRAVATRAPRVVAEGSPTPGAPFKWVIQVPIVWTFSGSQRDTSFDYLVQGVVTRMDPAERPEGIAITAISIARAQGVKS
jgi:hypothetical protein